MLLMHQKPDTYHIILTQQQILKEADIEFSFEDLMEVDRPATYLAKEKPKKEDVVKEFLNEKVVDENGDEIIEAK